MFLHFTLFTDYNILVVSKVETSKYSNGHKVLKIKNITHSMYGRLCLNKAYKCAYAYTSLRLLLQLISNFVELVEKINTNIEHDSTGRLFAVVQLQGKQRKVTTNDLVLMKYHLEADIGEKILLNKVRIVFSRQNNFVNFFPYIKMVFYKMIVIAVHWIFLQVLLVGSKDFTIIGRPMLRSVYLNIWKYLFCYS